LPFWAIVSKISSLHNHCCCTRYLNTFGRISNSLRNVEIDSFQKRLFESKSLLWTICVFENENQFQVILAETFIFLWRLAAIQEIPLRVWNISSCQTHPESLLWSRLFWRCLGTHHRVTTGVAAVWCVARQLIWWGAVLRRGVHSPLLRCGGQAGQWEVGRTSSASTSSCAWWC
jgi:hypothetical protein